MIVRKKKDRKTSRGFELGEQTRHAFDDHFNVASKRPGDVLFTGRRGAEANI